MIDAIKWVRHVYRDLYNDHNAQMTVLTKQVKDFIHSQSIRLETVNTPATTNLKDSSTEVEKRAEAREQEKAIVGDKGKRKIF